VSKDVGDPWTPQLHVTDSSGGPVAATVTLLVTAPDGTTDTPTVTTPSTGLYQATVLLTQTGQWTAAWTSSGAVTGTEAQHVYVRTLGVNVVDLAEAKQHLNIDDDEDVDDDEVEFFVDAANEWVATQVDAADLTARPVQLATRELIRHWWVSSQLGPASPADLEADDIGLIGLRIPPIVHEMLGPFLAGDGAEAPAPLGSFPDALDWPDPVCG
jgi:hypothetical protein